MTSAAIEAVGRTLLAFQALGKMLAHVYMRLTEVLRLIFSLLPQIPIRGAGMTTGQIGWQNIAGSSAKRTA
ncbi:hypothetical protein [Sinorhizobium medicae]|uniref:hypothetical protein n=1 Tax=Sinorhizobium medicae TaxID=110321 RepID=UPI000425E853|nr:hypothetical protein [Sinorhizobium medicae]